MGRLSLQCLVAICLIGTAFLAFGTKLAAAPGDDPAARRRPRKVAAGVETTIPLKRAEDETNANHPVVELQDGVPDLEWDPKTFEKTKTLFAKSKEVLFRRGIWQLQLTFKPLRMIRVDLPQLDGTMKTKLVWYMVYRITNVGNHMTPVRGESEQFNRGLYTIASVDSHSKMLASIGPIRFTPTFLLRIHKTDELAVDDATVQYMDQIIPAARRAIYLREQPNCSFAEFFDTVQMSKDPIPVSSDKEIRSRWGVVTWMDLGIRVDDTRLRDFDYFTVQIMGLTNAYKWVDPAGAFKPGDPPGTGRQFVYKTLQLNFYRPGDEFDAREDEIQLGVKGHPKSQWLYRPAPRTHRPSRPVQ